MIRWLRARKRERAKVKKIEAAYKQADKAVIESGHKKGKPYRVLVGPTNSAGQATLWARALTSRGYPSQSLRIANDPTAEWFRADIEIPRLEWTAKEGRIDLGKRIAGNFDAILIESMRPLLSLHTLRDYTAVRTLDDIKLLRKARVRSAIVFHGSDIRDTVAHAKREKFSPYRHSSTELNQLQSRAAEFRGAGRKAIRRRIPVFVTTPDLLLDMPGAKWLPITIDVAKFESAGSQRPCWNTPGPVRVLFQPSKGWLKSADLVAPILAALNSEGVIELLANEPVPHEQMAQKIAEADVVIDRFDGVAGVASIEALAAKRIVIANIAPWAYRKSESLPPVVHATPATLEATLREIALKRANYENNFEAGLAYARQWHDGTESASRIVRALKVKGNS